MFEPSVTPSSETVHGAVQMHSWYLLVGLEDPIDDRFILDVCRTFVVNNHIVLFRPIQFGIER